MIVDLRPSVEVMMAERAEEVAVVAELLVFLSAILVNLLSPHEDLVFLSHFTLNVITKDFLRANDECALAFDGKELYTVVLRHNVLLYKFILGVAAKLLNTELKADVILHSANEVCVSDSLGVHLEQGKHSLYDLGQLVAAVDHLSR